MSILQKKFTFPTKLWLLLSLGIFLYLFFRVSIEYKGDQPTLLRELLDGGYVLFIFGSVLYFLTAFCSGFFIAAIFGIFKTLLRKHDPLEIPPAPTPASK
jgi:hypothetical protein